MCYFFFFIAYLHFGSFLMLLFHSLGLGFFCDSKGLFPSSLFPGWETSVLVREGTPSGVFCWLQARRLRTHIIATVKKLWFTFREQVTVFQLCFSFSPSSLLFLLGIWESLKFPCFTSLPPTLVVMCFLSLQSLLFLESSSQEKVFTLPNCSENRPLFLPLLVFILVWQIFFVSLRKNRSHSYTFICSSVSVISDIFLSQISQGLCSATGILVFHDYCGFILLMSSLLF